MELRFLSKLTRNHMYEDSLIIEDERINQYYEENERTIRPIAVEFKKKEPRGTLGLSFTLVLK